MSAIDEEMYLLAKKVVATYEQTLDPKDVRTRSYTYADMKLSFSGGINNGCYIASKIRPPVIDPPYPDFNEFIKAYGAE